MKGVSGIVATAILLALTIAGGLLLYTYVSRYLVASTQSGELVVESAYYLTTLKRLEVTVRNIGMSSVNVTEVEIIYKNSPQNISLNSAIIIPPGKAQSILIENITAEPLYVIVKFDYGRRTEPAMVKILG
jgi:flagellin-like protein